MIPALPSQCHIALKEWASVVSAMARGEQLILIRKGGLAEAKSGFELRSPVFLLYPTFEHQTGQFLREPYRHYLDEALATRPSDGQVRFELCGVVASSTATHDASVIERLSPFHIYNEAFLHQRLKWQPEQPLMVTVVRTFRLPSSQLVPVVSRYAGCKSWVDLEDAIFLEGASPVVADQVFAERLAQIQSLL